MKKTVALLLLAFTLIQPFASAQSKQKAETAFLKELNSILKNSKAQHWKYNGVMSVDSAFAINTGILSVSVRYTNEDSSFVRSRMEAPVNKILRVAYDLYLILEFNGDGVTVYESEPNSNELTEQSKTNYFHIGEPNGDGFYQKEKLQKLLEKMLKYK